MENKNNLNNINKENKNRNPDINFDPFWRALSFAEQKFRNLFNNSKNYKDSKIIQKVIDDNIYVLGFHKKQKYSNFYDNLIKKNSEEKNFTIKSTNTNDFLSDKNLFLRINSNKDVKNSYPTNDINNKEDYLNKKSSEETKQNNYNNIYQDLIKKEINNFVGLTNGINNSNNKIDTININSNINFNNYNDNNDKNMFVGNKRYSDNNKNNEKTEKSEKDYIYDEIKRLFQLYKNIIKKNKIKEEKENKVYENEIGFFEKAETLIMEGKATCIVYLNPTIISKIYLIVDGITIDKSKEIVQVLNKIKKDLNKTIDIIKDKRYDENE